MRCVRNNKGFTLIEIIVVIVIISILSVISIFTFGNIRESSKNKADELAYNSIMKSAASYANEYYNEEKYWLHIENEDIETFCVPVLELSNKGYLKQDDINNVSYNFVLLTRDYINKTIIREEYDKEGICGGSTDREKGVLQLISQSTTSISVSGGCESSGFVNYTYGLFDKNNNEIKNYTTKDDTYKFSNLNINTQYYIKLKCNYQDYNNTDYSDGIKVQTGYTDLEFIPKNIVKDTTKNRVYKEIDINYTSKNIYKKENAIYYFKVTSEENISTSNVFECGNDKTPSLSCSSNSTTELKKGYWYKTTSNNNKLNIYNNSTIYTKIWDGERFSTNKSIQVILPTNPYVIVNIKHKLYNGYNGSFVGEDNNIIDYNINNWMSMPDISWNIYSGYETESIVYYSNSGNDDDDYSNRRSADLDSGYKCNSNSCTFNKGNIGNNGGMQQIKIVVKNKTTNDKTIIYINVNIDKKAPIFNISNSSNGKWTNRDVILDFDYSDKHSGININEFKWQDDVTYKDYRPYDEENKKQYKWDIEGERVAKYEICDYADNCTELETDIKIDKTPPKLEILSNSSNGDWTNQNITVELKYSDDASGIAPKSLIWSINKESWQKITENTSKSNYTGTWSKEDIQGDNRGCYRIKDRAGNYSEAVCTPIKIDTKPPTAPEITNPHNNEWSNKAFPLTLKSSDNLSGIAYYQYTYNSTATTTGRYHNINWVTYNNSNKETFETTQFSDDRNQSVYVRACDNAGNCSDKNSTYIKIDTKKPTITLKNLSVTDNEGWTTGNVTIKITFSDERSGINASSLQWHDSASQTTWRYIDNNNTSSYVAGWGTPGDRTGYYQICDNAGNCNEASIPIKINKYENINVTTNGAWYIWTTPGYVSLETSICPYYIKKVGTGCLKSEDATDILSNYGVGTTNRECTKNCDVKVKLDNNNKLLETSGSGDALFIKIYVTPDGINPKGLGGCYHDGDITKCKDYSIVTINEMKYYGVWIKATCEQDGKTCPADGISLHGVELPE